MNLPRQRVLFNMCDEGVLQRLCTNIDMYNSFKKDSNIFYLGKIYEGGIRFTINKFLNLMEY